MISEIGGQRLWTEKKFGVEGELGVVGSCAHGGIT